MVRESSARLVMPSTSRAKEIKAETGMEPGAKPTGRSALQAAKMRQNFWL